MMRRVAIAMFVALLVSVVIAGDGLTAPAPVIRLDMLTFPAMLSAPADRLEVRQAVAFALDRPAIAALIPMLVPAAGINHPKLRGYNPQVRGYPYDPARARALLSQASWSADSVLKIYVSTSRGYVGPEWAAVRAKIRDDLGAVDIKTEYVAVPFNTVVSLIDSGTAAVIIGWASDPHDFGYPYFSVGIAHDWKYKDADALLAQFQQAADQAQKDKIAQEVEQLLLDRALVVPLFFRG